MSRGPQRWLCWPNPDKVCIEGGCGYCDPFGCACGKRHTGSRRFTLPQMEALVAERGIDATYQDVLNGMGRQPVTPRDREHLTDYADHRELG